MNLKNLFAVAGLFAAASLNAGNLNVEKTAVAVSESGKGKDAIFYINTDTGYAGSVTVRPEGTEGTVRIVPHSEKGRYSLDVVDANGNKKAFAATVWVKK